ncbi:MAG TPA: putative metal-binding motif-containing protein, partial [Myxococcota bacterium]|nr:putative metal-binding motif-containing protein [Myxococcota bacterium]
MRLTCLAWSAFALACLGCDFSPGLGDGYPACVDGACLRAGCECLGGQVCVPQDPREGPEACQPTACEEGESCDDGDACTLAERCAAGQCQGGTQVDCDDQDACTQDGCDSFTGCTHDAITGLPAEGPPGDPGCANLLDDDCDGQTDGLDPGCVACSEDSECEDLDPCTQDSCTGGACANLPAGDGQACDDSDGCTAGETCLEGDCQGGSLRDVDGDGYADIQCGGDDCDDQLGAVNPGSPEVGPGSSACADGLDNDCDGAVDYADPSCQGGPPAGPLCGPLGWCWENPLPQGNDLLGVWGQGAQAWGVGPNGIIVRFDAAGLALEPLDRFDDLRAIHGEGSTLVTVGGNRAYQRVAGDWIGVVFEQSVEAFFDVWVEAGGVLWLAGREGAVWRFESNTGAPFPPPSGADVLAVSAVEGIPWAADSVGARFRWAGSAWEDTAVDTDGLVMLDLAAFRNTQPQPETEALAIGGGGRVEVYREGVWNAQLDLAPELYGLFWDPGAGGLVAGDGVLYVQDDPLSGQWQPQLGAVGEAYRGVWS